MITLSKYLVTVPIEGSSKVIAFSTRTGKVCTISNTVLDKLTEKKVEEIPIETLEQLMSNEVVVGEGENELETIISQNKAYIEDRTMLYEVIQPTAMCQLGCGYCGQQHTKDYLQTGAAEKILQRIESRLQSGKYKHLSIGWFGSEPLMGLAQIRTMTPELIALAAKYNCGYSSKMVSNGLSLKEPIFLELVQKWKVQGIEVTLDGTAEYHDKRRYTKDGLSTFDLIFNNLLKILNRPDFKSLGCGISLRCNVDATNYDSVKPLIHLLAENNLQDKISYFYVAPVHKWGNDAYLMSLEKEEFAKLEMEWLLEQFKYGFTQSLLPQRKHQVCISVTNDSEVFDAFGNVYDCSETPLVDTYANTDYVLGNINNGPDSISSHRPLLSFYDEVLDGDYPCTKCPMLPTCGGGCPKSWREGIVACPSPKSNIKDRLLLYYFIKKHGMDALRETVLNSN